MSREEMISALNDAGLPDSMISRIGTTDLLDEHLKKRILAASDIMISGTQVLQVFGLDTPLKEEVCARLMTRFMLKKQKTGRWLTPARISTQIGDMPKGAGVIAILGIDLLTPQQVKVTAQMIRDWILAGRTFILSVSSQEVLQVLFGRDLTSYLSHYSAIVEIESPSIKPLRV